MAKIGEAHVDLIMRTRWDTTDPVVVLVFWTLMAALGAVLGLTVGMAV